MILFLDIQYQEPDRNHVNDQHESTSIIKQENASKQENESVQHENESKQGNESVQHENESNIKQEPQTYSDTPITIKQEVSTDNQAIIEGAGASYGAWTTVSVRLLITCIY